MACNNSVMPPYYPAKQQQHAPPPHLHERRRGRLKAADTLSLRCGLPSDVINASSSGNKLELEAVHARVAKLGLAGDLTVRNALLTLYLALGDRSSARALFASDSTRDVVSWTAMVTGHTQLGFPADAAALFLAMFDANTNLQTIDAVAVSAGFAACATAGSLAMAREAHRRVEESGVALDAVAWNALVHMYAACGDLVEARRWFRKLPEGKRNVVTWNTMISALARAAPAHAAEEALALFREMQVQQVQPDDATMVAVLGACARIGALDTGRWVHAYYLTRRLRRHSNPDGAVGNALLDMYAKCGDINAAIAVFTGMKHHDTYTYSTMVNALATHGRADAALALFTHAPSPNSVTLLAALTACCHSGRVDAGLRLLRATESGLYPGVTPGVEHYGCAVDMLGRAGRLDEAESLAAGMPVPPDALVRGALLAACRARGDVERAERIVRRFGGGGGDAGDHVLLANAYAARGRHSSALRVRRRMRKSKIVKDPGCSSIEIDGVVHEFKAVPANAHRTTTTSSS